MTNRQPTTLDAVSAFRRRATSSPAYRPTVLVLLRLDAIQRSWKPSETSPGLVLVQAEEVNDPSLSGPLGDITPRDIDRQMFRHRWIARQQGGAFSLEI
jgi:hypothetical protein